MSVASPWKQAALRSRGAGEAAEARAPEHITGASSATSLFPFLFPLPTPLELDCAACGTAQPASAAGEQCGVCGFVVGTARKALSEAWARAPAEALDFPDLPPGVAARAADAAAAPKDAAPEARCVACSPARRCAAHAPRAVAPPAARALGLKAKRVPQAPRGTPLRDRSNRQPGKDAEAYVAQVDAACREHVLAAAARSAGGQGTIAPSVEFQRAIMGGDKPRAAPRLDTAWSTEASCPRSRVRCMLAAGWTPIEGTFGSHPRWERTLQAGPLAGTRQCLNFSGSYSTFCWDAQSADLQRMDRIACGAR